MAANSPILIKFLRQYWPNEVQDKHKNKSTRESCFFMFRSLQSNITCFFINNIFMYQQAEFWFEIITIPVSKGTKAKQNNNNKNWNWNTCWVKSIIAIKSTHPLCPHTFELPDLWALSFAQAKSQPDCWQMQR